MPSLRHRFAADLAHEFAVCGNTSNASPIARHDAPLILMPSA
jgi:hypothetical protein